MQPSLIILVGIPGCGKSTLAKQVEKAEVISSDQIREELTGDMSDQSLNRAVFYTMNKLTKTLLNWGVSVVIDATNLRTEYRKDLHTIADQTGARPFAIRFGDSEDFDLCQTRNLNRERIVPEDVMLRFHDIFMEHCSEEQLRSEGWDTLTHLD